MTQNVSYALRIFPAWKRGIHNKPPHKAATATNPYQEALEEIKRKRNIKIYRKMKSRGILNSETPVSPTGAIKGSNKVKAKSSASEKRGRDSGNQGVLSSCKVLKDDVPEKMF